MSTKVCIKCGNELPKESFHKHPLTKDGFDTTCKKCKNAYNAERARKKREEKRKIEEQRVEFEKKYKVYTHKDLAVFTPRELMLELKARGYEGELVFIERIVKEHRINLNKLD